MSSDANLTLKAAALCKSTTSQRPSFVRPLRLLIRSTVADAAWRGLRSGAGAFIPLPGFQSCPSPLDNQETG